ncbi:MAG: hypothetical protein [Cressdnaviricota sp.]|nr:MAG: hypothetical protein [Cressdnaviricota sp.]
MWLITPPFFWCLRVIWSILYKFFRPVLIQIRQRIRKLISFHIFSYPTCSFASHSRSFNSTFACKPFNCIICKHNPIKVSHFTHQNTSFNQHIQSIRS